MQQISVLFYKLRFVLGGFVILALLVLFSAIATAMGTNTVLDARTNEAPAAAPSPVPYDSSNAVTVGAYGLADGTKRATLTAGTKLYETSRSFNALTVRSGKTVAHVSSIAAQNAFRGTSAIARGIATGTMAVFGAPGKVVHSVTSIPSVSTLIRPADEESLPVIDAETSTAVLKNLNAQKQQEIAQLLAGQLAANRRLAVSVSEGDPNHGGYPARWANARQDSLIDSWGMYNRECVSYAAWKVFQAYGHMPYWGGVGNANQWVRNAKRAGIPTSAVPKVHSVAISMRGYYGHAMWVEKVQGNMIYISQYNWDLRGHYSEMWVNASQFTYIYFD